MQEWMGYIAVPLHSVCWGFRNGAAAPGHPLWDAESHLGGCGPLLWGELRFGREKLWGEGQTILLAEFRHSSLRRRKSRMRVAVRKRMGVRMKMRTRAVKRAWWTQTRMQRRRVKGRSACSPGHGGHLLVSLAMSLLLGRQSSPERPNHGNSHQLLCPLHVL